MIRVLVADDHQAIRAALGDLISAEPWLELVGVARDATEAIDLAERYHPDVVLLDVRMPGGGAQVAGNLRWRCPDIRVVALSAHSDRTAVLDMMRSGAVGYLVKSAEGAEVVDAIRRAAQGRTRFSEEVTEQVVGELTERLRQQERAARDQRLQRERIEAVLDSPAQLEVVWQPIVDLRDSRTVGAEALARFVDADRRGPDSWFAEATEAGLGAELELLAVSRALSCLASLPDSVFVGLNVSPDTIVSDGFLAALGGAPMNRVVVEITEHAPVRDYSALEAALASARKVGLRVAIDDAGAGYSSLQHILQLTPDIIKLDVSLTRNIDVDPRRRALGTALIRFAREIGAEIIAEGIETGDEESTLRALGAAYGQGYHLARPARLPLPMRMTSHN